MNSWPLAICVRLHDVRLRVFGPRGKARFAARLGIRASTYQQYEATRVPPVDLLVRAAEITGCDLVWLLTGSGSELRLGGPNPATEEPIVGRVQELVRRRPETVQSLTAFLTLIDAAGPASLSATSGAHTEVDRENQQSREAHRESIPTVRDGAANEMIPVVGSTAAGPARFWRETLLDDQGQQNPGDEPNTRLERLLAACGEQSRSTEFGLLHDPAVPELQSRAALVQFSSPDELGILEFLSCPGIRASQPPLVAWRIDGDSMMPRYRDGDFVLVSSRQPAIDGYPCVAHQRGQIGVNCKIFKRETSEIVLVPVNEAYPPQRFPAADLVWANRVLYLVRLAQSVLR